MTDPTELAAIRRLTHHAHLRTQDSVIPSDYDRGYLHGLDDVYRLLPPEGEPCGNCHRCDSPPPATGENGGAS